MLDSSSEAEEKGEDLLFSTNLLEQCLDFTREAVMNNYDLAFEERFDDREMIDV